MVTARSLNKRSTTILIAVVLALGTGLLLFNYLSTVSHTASASPMRSVVLATREIPPHTIVAPEMLAVSDRAQDAVDPDASASAAAVIGQVALIDIPAGSTLSASKVGRADLGGLTMLVPVGQRAISIALDPVKGVADLIQAGDRVDVIAVTQPHGLGETPRAVTILRDKVVLAMGTAMSTSGRTHLPANSTAGDTAVQTATLEVAPAEAKTLALADLNATLRLALRSPRERNHDESGDAFLMSAPVQPRTAAAPAPIAPPVRSIPRAVPHVPGIQLIDGDQIVAR